MRNILMTVMLIVVVVVMFNAVVMDGTNGTKHQIEQKGSDVNAKIGQLTP